MKKGQLVKTLVCAVLFLGLVSHVQADEKKVKVFTLAGQSNMEGHGQLRSLNHLGEHPKYGYLLKKIKNEDGSWAVRDDVTVSWKSRERLSGLLTVGWGFEPHEIGPELMFGTIMGDKYDEPVTELTLESPAGLIHVRAEVRDNKVKSVTFENVPAFAVHIDAKIKVPELGEVTVDVAYGGMFYVIAEASQFGLKIKPDNAGEITRIGEMIKVASQEQLSVVHPQRCSSSSGQQLR